MSLKEQLNYIDDNSFDGSNDYILSSLQVQTKSLFSKYDIIPLYYINDIMDSTSNNSNINEIKISQAVEKSFSQNNTSNYIDLNEKEELNQNGLNIKLIKNDENNIQKIDLLNKKTLRENNEEIKITTKNYDSINISANHFFITKKYKNRGRKKDNKSKRPTHDCTADDNVKTKIQVHFLKFLINLTNDILQTGQIKDEDGNDIFFQQINYKDKANITLEYMKQLKLGSIKDILQKDTSSKFPKYGKDYNKDKYEYISKIICKDKSLYWIQNYFNTNYLYAFRNFYKTKSIIFNEKTINFSEGTEFFNDLLEKNDESMKECLIRISDEYSEEEKLSSKKNIFVSKKE